MKIIIKSEGDKVFLNTSVRGNEVEFGLEKLEVGGWVQCTEKNLDDYHQTGELTAYEVELLGDIDLVELHKALA